MSAPEDNDDGYQHTQIGHLSVGVLRMQPMDAKDTREEPEVAQTTFSFARDLTGRRINGYPAL